jgi:predicted small integral membrane protein
MKQFDTVKEDRKDAWSVIHANLWGGLALTIFGVMVAASTKPSVTPATGIFDSEATGSQGGYDFGLVCAGVGSLFVTLALIAWAITLGVRASRADAPIVAAHQRPPAPEAVVTTPAPESATSEI